MCTIGRQSIINFFFFFFGLELQKCPLVSKTNVQARKYIMHSSLDDSLDVPWYLGTSKTKYSNMLPLHKLH